MLETKLQRVWGELEDLKVGVSSFQNLSGEEVFKLENGKQFVLEKLKELIPKLNLGKDEIPDMEFQILQLSDNFSLTSSFSEKPLYWKIALENILRIIGNPLEKLKQKNVRTVEFNTDTRIHSTLKRIYNDICLDYKDELFYLSGLGFQSIKIGKSQSKNVKLVRNVLENHSEKQDLLFLSEQLGYSLKTKNNNTQDLRKLKKSIKGAVDNFNKEMKCYASISIENLPSNKIKLTLLSNSKS